MAHYGYYNISKQA
jgi:NhaP-type Na+/H+ or K+/H+ antiporter